MKATQWSSLSLLVILFVAPSMQQRTNLDLAYVIDSSRSMGEANFNAVKQSILDTILPQIGPNLAVGVVQYGTGLIKAVELTQSRETFQREVSSLAWRDGETNTEIGIQWGLSILLNSADITGGPKLMIVVVDGVSRFPTDTKSMADFTRSMGVEIWAIGIGNDITDEELINIAGDPSRVLKTQSAAALPTVDLQLPAVTGTPRPITPAPTTPAPTTTSTTTTPAPTTTSTIRTPPPTTTTRPTPAPTTIRTPAPTTTTRPTPAPTTTTRRTPAPTTTTRRTPAPTTTTRRTPAPTTTRRTPVTRPTVTTRPPVITTTRSTTPFTTRRAPTTPYVEPFLDEGLCEDAVVINGVGYRAHPTDADKYVQCYFPSQARTLAVIRECPFGLLWNSQARLCDTYLRVRLSEDPCSDRRVGSHPHEGNCRTFYNCEGGRSVPRCCPAGYLYDAPSQRCSPCNACNESCPAMCSSTTFACNKYPVFNDPTVYRKWARTGDVLVPCENGTFFDLAACECVHSKEPSVCQADLEVPFRAGDAGSGMEYSYEDVALTGVSGVFDGVKSRVKVMTQPESAFDRPLVMRFAYKEADDVRTPIALVSTSKCGIGGLVLVSLERGGIKIEMSSYGRTPIIFRLPTAGFKKEDEKEVMLYHDREYLTVIAKSDKLTYMRKAKVAILPYLQCGLEFGNSDWMDGFSGSMRRVQLLRCHPSDFEIV